jgi:hypothetical protein
MLRKLILAVIVFALTFGTGCFSGIGPEEIVSFVLSDDSGNTIVGYRVQNSQEDHEIHLQKVDPNGTVMWDISLPVNNERRANIIGMAGGENESVYIAWEVLGPEGQRRSASVTRLARVDTNRQINFQKEFSERGIQLIAVDAGSVIVHQTHDQVSRSINLAVKAGCVILNQMSDKEFHAVRFDGDGNQLWSHKIPGRVGLKLAAGINGETLMMWQNPDYPYFVVQKLDATGGAIWGGEGVRIKYLETAFRPEHQIISDGSGGAIISWAEPVGGELPSYVWVCRIKADGSLLCDTPVLDLASNINIYTRVVNDGFGGVIVIWEDLRKGMALYAQKVNADGEVQWQENGVPVCTDLPVVSPRFEAVDNGAGGVVVGWIDGNRKLYAQMLGASGQRLWGNEGILLADGVCNQPVELCGDKQGGYIIGWSTGWDTYQPNDSFIQKIDVGGNLMWGEDGIKLKP